MPSGSKRRAACARCHGKLKCPGTPPIRNLIIAPQAEPPKPPHVLDPTKDRFGDHLAAAVWTTLAHGARVDRTLDRARGNMHESEWRPRLGPKPSHGMTGIRV